jgi:hypothetical protein
MYLHHLRSGAPLLLASLLCACSGKPQPAPDPAEAGRKAIESAHLEAVSVARKLAAVPVACTLGSAQGAPGTWTDAPHAAPQPGNNDAMEFTLDAPVAARAFQLALSAKAFHGLDKVEVRDAKGNWHLAWLGIQLSAPGGCDYVRLEQTMQNVREVGALRVSFHPGLGLATAGQVRLLRDAAEPEPTPTPAPAG